MTSLGSSGQSFTFKDHCLLCGLEDFRENETKLLKLHSVHLVGKLTMKDTVLKAAETRVDEWAQKNNQTRF